MRRLVCRLRGHRWVVARRLYPISTEAGVVLRWRPVYPLDGAGNLNYDGEGCTRCGRFCSLLPGDLIIYSRPE